MNKKQIQLKKKAKEAKAAKGKKSATSKDSKAKAAKDRVAVQCVICRQAFSSTTKQAQLELHVDKHSKAKKTFKDCFPGYTE
jgi:hypothetical protein